MYLRQARLVMLIGCIEGEQRKLARGDGLAVASHLRIGRSLVSLRELAGPGWAEQAESLGYDRQLASRYVALGDSPLGTTALTASHLLDRLPPDLTKLEAICVLTIGQVERLAAEIDLKTSSPDEIINAVRNLPGSEAPPARAHWLVDPTPEQNQ
jgi:hypothetical protein